MSGMTRSDRDDFAHFALMLARQPLAATLGAHQVVNLAAELSRIAGILHRLDEHACNRELTSRERLQEAVAEPRAAELVASIGCELVRNGDPRGPSILVKLSTGETDDWGRRGWCVPW